MEAIKLIFGQYGNELQVLGAGILAAVSWLLGRDSGKKAVKSKQIENTLKAAEDNLHRQVNAEGLTEAEIDARNNHWLNRGRIK